MSSALYIGFTSSVRHQFLCREPYISDIIDSVLSSHFCAPVSLLGTWSTNVPQNAYLGHGHIEARRPDARVM